jgi:hypothetical protein
MNTQSLYLTGFKSELFAVYMRRYNAPVLYSASLTVVYLNIIPLFGTVILISTQHLTSVKETPRPEIIFCFMYTILLPDDDQSNRPKHAVEVYSIYYILISCVFSEHEQLNGNLYLASKTTIYFIQQFSTVSHVSGYTTIIRHKGTSFKNK